MKTQFTKWILFLLIPFVFACSKDEPGDNFKIKSNKSALGASARDLLSDETFGSLNIEIVAIEGFEPSSSTIKELKAFLEKRTYKPNGIKINTRKIPAAGDHSYTTDRLLELEDKYRRVYNSENEIAVYIFFADAASDSKKEGFMVLGTAYRNTSIVIYENSIRELAVSGMVPKSKIESSALKHEFGHLFGLVGNGTSEVTPHVDPENKAHCQNSNCLMAASMKFGAGTLAFIKRAQQGDLDEDCLADLRTNGGK